MWWLGLALALLVAGPAWGQEVRSGDLVARVEADPPTIVFSEGGKELLRQSALFARDALGRHDATTATVRQEGDAVVADVVLDDPLGRKLSLRVAPDVPGVVALTAALSGADADALGIGFARAEGEQLLGLGERPIGVDHWGREVETYVADGPYQPGAERLGLSLFVPPPGFRDRDDATYFPIPWVLSTRGHGVLLDNAETAYHRFGTEAAGEWSAEATGTRELRVRVFGGGTPRRALRRFTARLGRQPRADAPWIFGPWFQTGGDLEEQRAQIATLREAGAPVSVAQTYLHYLPCGDQRGGEAAERERVAALHALGLATTTYFNPMLCQDYQPLFDEAVAAGALTKRADGSAYVYRYSSGTGADDTFFVGQFDFTAAAGRDLYQRLLGEAVADGHDGWMEDFGEYTPTDAYAADGSTGTALHNRYVRDYHCTAHDFVRGVDRPVVRFQRSGFTGTARCAQVVWSGDPTTSWGFDGLASQVKAALSAGVSGISTWGSDIGGFFAIGPHSLTPELLMRWVQFGALSPVMRTQRNGVALPSKDRPQVEDPDQIANWARWSRLHQALYPYLVAADRAYSRRGVPIMRHLALAYPHDERAAAREDAYLFGPDLLAAPVLEPGITERPIYLPRGRWVDVWRSASADLDLGSARVLQGGADVVLPAPADELPLLARAGTLLALLPRDIDTLADYEAPGVTRLADRPGRLRVVAFPRGPSAATFLEGERLRSRETRRGWELRIRGERRRRYSVQASLATLRRPFTPCRVRGADRWRFDTATQVLHARVRAKRARLVARACR